MHASSLSSRAPTAAPLRARAPSSARRAARVVATTRVGAAKASSEDGTKKMTVAVTGATGFVGRALVRELQANGHDVRVLTRDAFAARLSMPGAALKGAKFYANDTANGYLRWFDAVDGCTGVVNLAGASISNPWNEAYKKTLVESRLRATKRVVDGINAVPKDRRPTLVSSSAVGYYGTSKTKTFDENSAPGRDFLARLCVKWEREAKKADTPTTIVRTGVVLEKGGGALGKILPIFQLYGGGPLGDGSQRFSWIHRDDLVALIVAALEDPEKYEGTLNGTAPEPTTMNGLCEAVSAATNRPNWLPVPGVALRLLLGEGATVVLDGQRVEPRETLRRGFKFSHETVDDALCAIVRGDSSGKKKGEEDEEEEDVVAVDEDDEEEEEAEAAAVEEEEIVNA
jgi:uncharacterized protein (TIGR01777 family)